jgi:VanZ family protein
MSKVFFDEMQIPTPQYNLNINSLGHGAMTGRAVVKYQKGAGWIAALVYGITDEIHQSFVPMRDASMYDVMADSIGSFVGAYFYKHFSLKEILR